MTKYETFLCELLAEWQCKPDCMRYGQTLMILLHSFDKNKYREMYYLDCFYNDKLIPNTLALLKETWNGT